MENYSRELDKLTDDDLEKVAGGMHRFEERFGENIEKEQKTGFFWP